MCGPLMSWCLHKTLSLSLSLMRYSSKCFSLLHRSRTSIFGRRYCSALAVDVASARTRPSKQHQVKGGSWKCRKHIQSKRSHLTRFRFSEYLALLVAKHSTAYLDAAPSESCSAGIAAHDLGNFLHNTEELKKTTKVARSKNRSDSNKRVLRMTGPIHIQRNWPKSRVPNLEHILVPECNQRPI